MILQKITGSDVLPGDIIKLIHTDDAVGVKLAPVVLVLSRPECLIDGFTVLCTFRAGCRVFAAKELWQSASSRKFTIIRNEPQ